jgi:hypothetical protein
MANYRKMVMERKVNVKKKVKKEVSRKFPKFVPWEHVDYNEQTIEYFAKFKELPCIGVTPKVGITTELVTTKDIIEVFGTDCSSFKTMNLHLHMMLRGILLSYTRKFMDLPTSQIMSSCFSLLKGTLQN